MINSREYWNNRFQSGSWDELGGQDQTLFFNKLALSYLPQWIYDDIESKNLSIIDVGCAEGSGTSLIKNTFSRSNVVGVDFSESAIEFATRSYPACEFKCQDLDNISDNYEVVFSSNVLEHFVDPFNKLEKLKSICDKYLILLLPFQEDKLHEEHFIRFDYGSFNLSLNNFYLCYYKVINTNIIEGTMWPGKQILLVYVNNDYIKFDDMKLSKINNNDFNEKELLLKEIESLKSGCVKKDNIIQRLQTELNEVNYKLEEEKNKYIEEVQKLKNVTEILEENKQYIDNLSKELGESKQYADTLSRKLEEKELQLTNKNIKLEDFNKIIHDAKNNNIRNEDKIKELESCNSITSNNLDITQSAIKDTKKIALSLADTKLFKMVHLVYRIKQQLLKGNFNDKKEFFKWLRDRKNFRKGLQDHSYNPLFQIINNLENINLSNDNKIIYNQKVYDIDISNENATPDFISYWEDAKMLVDLSLSEEDIKRVATLKNIINSKQYKGIIVYPHIVNWEPPQTPQQLFRAFADKGYLCLFSENSNTGNKEVEIEPNIILTNDNILINALGDKEVIVLCTWIPMLPIINAIPNKIIWYHVLDHIEIFSGYCNEYERLHNLLLQSADVVTYVAVELKKHSNFKEEAVYLPNGCNTYDFISNLHEGFMPEPIKQIVKKDKRIIGYYGYIAKWFDMKTVYELACRNENWVFVLIGDCIADFEQYKHDRIILLGRKSYIELADYAKYFDVAIIPFEINEMMDCVSPIKFFEYCTLGLPVVTSYMKEMEQFRGESVYLANNVDEFNYYINRALEPKIKEHAKKNGKEIALSNTWDKRVESMEFQFRKLSNYDIKSELKKDYNKFDILFLSVIDYDFRYQRPQHLAHSFSDQGHRVFYINANYNNKQTETLKTINNINIISIKSERYSSVHIADYTNESIDINKEVENIVIDNCIRDCLVIVQYPTWVQAAEYVKNKYGFKVITDYLDDYTGFKETNIKCLSSCCEKLLKNSDLVIASSNYLAEIANRYNSNVKIVRNGTEFNHFNKAYREKQYNQNRKNIVGYYGAISHWFDFEKIIYLAKNLPDVDIVLIGEVTEGKEKLSKYSNIKILGEMQYNKLPDYLKDFDVCLIPFDTSTDLIKATNPVKFYEYLSAAKKVVATEIPELMPFKDKFVYLTNDNKEFLNYVKLCLEGKDNLAKINDSIDFAKENDWLSRGNQFIEYSKGVFPKVSIVLLTYNQLEYTKECIDSIIYKTAYPNYELIIVDNASSDNTPEYLKQIETKNHNIKVFLNDKNLGFAAGNNVGISQSNGDYILLLNNDTVVTRGWLTNLIKHFDYDKKLGIIGPVTNSISNESKINVTYSDISDMDYFAYEYTKNNMNKTYDEIEVLAMFCIMISRQAFNDIGYLEQIYGIGMFEDDDYSYKAKSLGYKIKCAEDSFVHHYGNVSFKKLDDEEYMKLFNRNRKIFEERWKVKWEQHRYRPDLKN